MTHCWVPKNSYRRRQYKNDSRVNVFFLSDGSVFSRGSCRSWFCYQGDRLVPVAHQSHRLQKMTKIDTSQHALSTTSMCRLNTSVHLSEECTRNESQCQILGLKEQKMGSFSVWKLALVQLVCEEQSRRSCSYSFPGQNASMTKLSKCGLLGFLASN